MKRLSTRVRRQRVQPRARITAVLSQDVEKLPGDTLTVTVTWSNQTTDHEGNPISWPFALRALMIGPGGPFQSPAQSSSMRSPGSQTNSMNISIPTSAPDGAYTVSVHLTADGSDGEGNPDGSLVTIAQVNAADQVIVVSPTGPADPAANISNIALSQRGRRG